MRLSLENASVYYGDTPVFTGGNFTVNEGEHIGLVGRNGVGKTTLLRTVTGEVPLFEGTLSNSGFTVGHLSQIALSGDETLEETLKNSYKEIRETEKRIESLSELIKTDREYIEEYTEATERFRLIGGYSYVAEYRNAVKSFGFSEEELSKPISSFSGGERTKIALLCLMLSSPSLLLLDEPTNNLDIDAIRWLETFLSSYKGSFVLVSHDREFLDKTVNIVYEIERDKITRFKGNYSKFSEYKKQKYESELKKYKNDKIEAERLSALIEKFRYKKNKAAFAQAKIKQLQRMGPVEKPKTSDTSVFGGSFNPETESGDEVLNIEKLSVGYTDSLSQITLNIRKGDKIAVMGANGIGKSTFLKTLIGEIPPIDGFFRFGNFVKYSFFSQDSASRFSEETVLGEMLSAFPSVFPAEMRNILGAFMFRGDDVFKETAVLSGGERVRLALCKVLTSKPNLLIMDEPTNHLDIPAKEALESILSEYTGTVLFVSHDRFFIRQISNKILVLDNSGSHLYPYGYPEYESNYTSVTMQKSYAQPEVKSQKKPSLNPLKELNRAKKRMETLEKQMSENEEKTNALKTDISSPEISSDYVKLQTITDEISTLEEEYLSYLTEWNDLSEKCVEFEKLL